jgi:hypothetical protein
LSIPGSEREQDALADLRRRAQRGTISERHIYPAGFHPKAGRAITRYFQEDRRWIGPEDDGWKGHVGRDRADGKVGSQGSPVPLLLYRAMRLAEGRGHECGGEE